MTNYIINIW